MSANVSQAALCTNCNAAVNKVVEQSYIYCEATDKHLCGLCAALHAPFADATVPTHNPSKGCGLCQPDVWLEMVQFVAAIHLTLVDCNNVPRYSVYSVPMTRRSIKDQFRAASSYFKKVVAPSTCNGSLSGKLFVALDNKIRTFFSNPNLPTFIATHTIDTDSISAQECSGRVAIVCNSCALLQNA